MVISSDISLYIDTGLPVALLQDLVVRRVKNAVAFLFAMRPLSLVDLS